MKRNLFKKFFVVLLIMAFVLCPFMNSNITASAAEWDKPGYILTFHDEFNGNSLDLSKWNNCCVDVMSGPWIVGNDNFAYVPENVSVSGGCLRIRAEYNPITCRNSNGGISTVEYRSGSVHTRTKFQQTYGWWEARIKMPDFSTDRVVPGFWLMPASDRMVGEDGPGTGSTAEVDIMEHITNDPSYPNYVTSALHWGGYGANYKGTLIGFSRVENTSDWHVYALDWSPGKLDIYVDGVKTHTYTGEGIPFGDEIAVLSMAMHTTQGPGFECEMLVDYIRVYEKDPNAPTPTPIPPVQEQDAVYNQDHANISYHGDWATGSNPSAYLGDYCSTNTRDSYYTINFTGKSLKTYGQKDSWCGLADIFIDDEYMYTIDTYSPTVEYDQLLFDTGELEYGNHTVKVVVLGRRNPYAEDCYINADKFEIEGGVTIYNNDDSSFIQYSRSWSYGVNENSYNGDYTSTNVRNSYYTINFTGTRLRAYAQKDSWCGMADIYVDNEYQQTIDTYSPTVEPNQLLYDTGELEYGNHTVRLVVLRQKNPAADEYYINSDWFEVFR